MEREPVPPAFMRDKLFVAFRAKRTPHELYDALKATGLFRIIDHKEGQIIKWEHLWCVCSGVVILVA